MTRFKIVITDFGSPENELEDAELRSSGLDYDLVRLDYQTADQLVPHIRDAHALIVQWAKIDQNVIKSLSQCKVISRYGIGVDMIDLQAAGAAGIPVANVPDFCIDEVSTHTMAFLLSLNRHLIEQHLHVKSGQWAGAPGGQPARLEGQTLGIVGLGKIGRAVAQKAKGFNLKLLGFDPYLSAAAAAEVGVELVDWETLLGRSDYVSLHSPLTAETRHMVNAQAFSLMKPTAYLINLSRGPVVDQVAMYQALVNGQIAGAALDVLEKEPPLADDALLALPNVLFTPHSSSLSATSFIQLRRDVARNVIMALKGQKPRSIVNLRELGW